MPRVCGPPSRPATPATAAAGVRKELRNDGVQIGRWLVRRLMREQQLRPVWRRKFVHTTDSRHTLPVAPNVLQRQFEPPARDRAWVCDMTYVRTRRGWLYLAAVMELYSRKIVGWAMSHEMPATLVCDALAMAIAQRRPAPGLIVHSDRGSQYASREHQELLTRHGLRASMSGKGNCWDTQSNIPPSAAFGLTRAGIGEMPLR